MQVKSLSAVSITAKTQCLGPRLHTEDTRKQKTLGVEAIRIHAFHIHIESLMSTPYGDLRSGYNAVCRGR
jgi:hypothetical protein